MDDLKETSKQRDAVDYFVSYMDMDTIEDDLWELVISAFSNDESESWNGFKRNSILFTVKSLLQVSKGLFSLNDSIPAHELTKKEASEGNLLQQAHTFLFNTLLSFRKQLCQDCNWGHLTYFRKMRDAKEGRLLSFIQELTKDETKNIIKAMDGVIEGLSNYSQHLKNTYL